MKIRLRSVYKIMGVAKETGANFGPLFRLGIDTPLEMVDSAKFKRYGNGWQETEMEIDEACFNQFVKIQIPPGGLELEVETDTVPGRRGGLMTVITGYRRDTPKAA